MTDSQQPSIIDHGMSGSVTVIGGAPLPGRPSEKLSPAAWLRRNLFTGPVGSVITVIGSVVGAYLAYRLARFVFVTGQWEAVGRNLENFIFGNGMRDDASRWRIARQALAMSLGIGFLIGNLSASARDTAAETGEPLVRTSWRTYLSSYWSVLLFVGLTMGAFVRTSTPWMILGGSIALAVAGWFLTKSLPRSLRGLGWTLSLLAVVVGFQFLSGTLGWAWFYTTVALVPLIVSIFSGFSPARVKIIGPFLLAAAGFVAVAAIVFWPKESDGIASFLWVNALGVVALGIAAYAVIQYRQGDRLDASRIAGTMVAAGIVAAVYRMIGLEGIDWKEWGGLHLSLVITSCSILLAFPLGVLLALGRRSSLPAVKFMCTVYIEFFRGAPLITFLLAAQFFLGFFLNTTELPSLVTRAVAAITLFTAAYIAEIVRGGLQAVPNGQVEAGQAVGLSADKITRLIVMPQALRAVIPAMVGQFISLFKDTTLLSIIALPDFLQVREIVHSQADFRGAATAETLVFVAFGFWAFSFAMSRESQRLERRLSVGQR